MPSTLNFTPSGQVSPTNSETLVECLRERQRRAASLLKRLSVRERQVVEMVAQGLPNKTVAIRLQLSIKTVEKHRGNSMRKLQLQTTCDLHRFWFQLTWDEDLLTS